jgi:anti-repressor protein
MNNLTIFRFENQQVRTIIRDNNPWFVAKDVCEVLGHTNSRVATERLDEDEKGVSKVYTPGGEQEMTVINESGLYALVLTSNIPKAKVFKRWITHEVIPQIRKSGVYVAPQVNSKMLYQIAQALEEKEKQIALLTPAAEFGNAVSNNAGGILIRDYVKVLENDGIRIGQDRLFSWLHLNKYIYRIKGYKPQWIPYKQYVAQGLFRVKETPVSTPDHGDWISYTIRLTGKGQRYFYEKLKAEFKPQLAAK